MTYELEVRLLSRNERHDGQLVLEEVAWLLVGKFEWRRFKVERKNGDFSALRYTWWNFRVGARVGQEAVRARGAGHVLAIWG